MPDVDTSIYSKFAPQPANPLDTAAKALALQGGMQDIQKGQLNNQLLGQQVRGKQALGQIIGQNTDDKGNVNWDNVSAQAGKDPNAAIMLPDLQKQVLDRKLSDLQVQGADLKLAGDRWAKVGDMAGALLAQKEPLTRPAVIKSVTDNLVGSGMFNDEHSVGQLVEFVKNLPEDDQGIRKMLQNVALQSNMTTDRIGAMYAAQHGGLSAEAATAPTPAMVRNPDGTLTPSSVTREQFVNATGQGPVATGAPLSKLGRTGNETAGLVDVYDPETKRMVKKPSGALVGDALPQAAPGARGAAGSPVAAGPALGEAPTAEANAARGVQIQHQALTAPVRLSAMRDVKSLLDAAPDTGFGPTGELTSKIGKVAAAFGVSSPQSVNGQASLEEMNKALTMIAAQQGQEMGAGTDASRAIVHDSNPSLANSKEGLRNNLAVVQGNEMWNVAKNRAWQDYQRTHPAADEAKFETAFNAKVSPLVFQIQNLNPAGQRRLWATLSGTKNKDGTWTGERGALLNATQFAEKHGWFEGQ